MSWCVFDYFSRNIAWDKSIIVYKSKTIRRYIDVFVKFWQQLNCSHFKSCWSSSNTWYVHNSDNPHTLVYMISDTAKSYQNSIKYTDLQTSIWVKMIPRCTCTSASNSHQIIIKAHVGSIAKKLPNACFINFTKRFMKYMQQVFTHVTFNNYDFISSHIIVLSNNSQSESKWNYLGWIYTFVEIPVYFACTKLPENAPLLWKAVVDISEKGTVLSFCSLPTATCYTAYYLPISGGGPNMGSGLGVINKRNGERSAKLINQFTLRGRQGWWNCGLLHKLAYCYTITKNDNLLHIPFWFGYINKARESDA